MYKDVGVFVSKQVSDKTQREYALFLCGIGNNSIWVDTKYLPKTVELAEGERYVIDISPFYSEDQGRCFLGYRILGKFFG